MGNVAANVNGVVAADGAGGGLERVGGAENGAALLDHVLALPDGGEDGARGHVLEETGKEGLLLEVLVVLAEERLRGLGQLDGDKLEAALLKAANDGGDEAALDTVGLEEELAM